MQAPHLNRRTALATLGLTAINFSNQKVTAEDKFVKFKTDITVNEKEILKFENSMRSTGLAYIQKYLIKSTPLGSSRYDHEHSVLYYDGAEVFRLQSLYFKNQDADYANKAKQMSRYLWEQYADVYGQPGSESGGYRKHSQWIFPDSARAYSPEHLKDMVKNSCYAAYDDGPLDAYNDSDTRGLAYLLDALATYEETFLESPTKKVYDNKTDKFVEQNQIEAMIEIVDRYCNNLGPIEPKTKELFYMLGILGNCLLEHRKLLSTYKMDVADNLVKILNYLTPFVEKNSSDEAKLSYGEGFVDDGSGANEVLAHYPGLEMIIAPVFLASNRNDHKNIGHALLNYGIRNTNLNLEKDYIQHYRWTMPLLYKMKQKLGTN